MLILLPPSEGKTAPSAGEPVDPGSLWLPQLAAARRRVLTRLVAMCRRGSPRGVAASLATLGLTAGQHAEVTRNAALPDAPSGPAAGVYSGVLYEALDAGTLGPAARTWLDERAVVFSGLWGVLRLTDRIPAYRCAVGVSLPVVGGLAGHWRRALGPALGPVAAESVVLDLRSGAYAGMWAPGGERVAAVRVLHERVVAGVATRSVVSHFNKATKGRIVRALAVAGARPGSVDELVAALQDLGYPVVERPAGAGRSRQLDVVVTEL